MTSNTPGTPGNSRAVPLADQLVSVKPIKGPVGLAVAIRKVYSSQDEFDQWMKEQRKSWHMNAIKEAGNDYEI